MRMVIFIVALLFIASLAYSDVGPGPTAPDITVTIFDNVSVIANISHITYHCQGTNSTASGAVEPSVKEFDCVKGQCKPSGWYYKFNPCFYSSGYFTYDSHGVEKQSNWLNFTEGKQYLVALDTDTGKAVIAPSGCLGTVILTSVLGIACFFARRNSG